MTLNFFYFLSFVYEYVYFSSLRENEIFWNEYLVTITKFYIKVYDCTGKFKKALYILNYKLYIMKS